jgi:hypothetical protein
MSADPTRLPLWFAEGIAEVFSTFAVEDGQGRWGRPSLSSVAFLQNTAMQPMAEFLLVTQDEAMHVNATFYSQAWLFVHYLLIGGVQDGGPALLGEFLTNWDSMAPLDAFRATFRMEPEAMDRLLRSYVRQDRLNVASTPLREQAREFEVVPAPAALVELSLARLAFGTGNEAPLSEHLDRLLAIAPDGAEAYDLIAAHAMREERDNIELLLDQAIERGSRDARTYELRAALLADSVRAREPMFAAGAFAAADARRIADHLVSSANLRPLNRRIYTSLADVLFSAQEIRDYDRLVFENGAVVFADAGIMLIGQAALALAAGDVGEARRLLEASLQPPYELSASERDAARALLRQLRP